MNVGSLFSGIGGLDLGFERAGMTVRWQVEIDGYCRRVLAKHWPDVKRFEDVRDCGEHNLEPVDLICGGFPCQPVSYAGRRKGDTDERWLWPEFARVVRCVKPRWVLAENVPGLLSVDAGRLFGTVLRDLAESGYAVEWDCIPAAAVGAPHIRDRVFIVAYAMRNGVHLQPRRFTGTNRQETVHTDGDGEIREMANAGSIHSRTNAEVFQAGQSELGGIGGWSPEPDVGRVVARISSELDGGLNAHERCKMQASTAGVPQTERLRALRKYLEVATTPSESERCAYCGHPLSSLPCCGACSPWYVGARRKKSEDVRCMREGLLGILAQQGQDVQPYLSERTWQAQRPQAVGDRIGRLRALGNAVVPQVAEWIGRRIIECEHDKVQ